MKHVSRNDIITQIDVFSDVLEVHTYTWLEVRMGEDMDDDEYNISTCINILYENIWKMYFQND